jgi:sugar transferase (PEP-CTERM system associated)
MGPFKIFKHYVPGAIFFLVLADAIFLLASAHMGLLLHLAGLPAFWTGQPPIWPKAMVFAVVGLFSFSTLSLYDHAQQRKVSHIAARVFSAAIVWWVLYGAVAFAMPALRLGRMATLAGISLGTLSCFLVRGILFTHPAMRRFRDRLIFLGATPMAERVISALEKENPGYDILGYLDDRPAHQVSLTNGFRILGTIGQLREVAAATGAGTIVVAMGERRGALPLNEILDCKLQGIRIEDWPTFYEKLTGKIVVQDLRPSWLIFSEGFDRTKLTRLMKRWGDFFLSAVFLATTWPLFILVAFAVKLGSPGPILFRQERVGEGGKPFTLLKFRTMIQDAEVVSGPVWATEEDPRITRVGRFLRKTRLDELPQVFNVLRGEMSFVGPRPERPHFVAQLQEKIPYYNQRHTVKPGITGWAQVRYRYGATVEDAEEKLQFDLYYIKNLSFFLDMLILLASVKVVLFGKGAR